MSYETDYDNLIAKHTDGTQTLKNDEFTDAVKSKFSNTDVENALQKTIAELIDATNVNLENDKISKEFFVEKMKEFQKIVDDATANATATDPNATGANANPTVNEAYIIVKMDGTTYSVNETNNLTFDDKNFPVKITIVNDCDQSNLIATQKCFDFGGVKYQIDWDVNIKKDNDINKKLLKESFLTSNASTATNQNTSANQNPSTTTNQNTSANQNPSSSISNLDNSCVGIVEDILEKYNKETKTVTSIDEFYKYIPTYLFLNDIIVNDKECINNNDSTQQDIYTTMDEIYLMTTNIINTTTVDSISDINNLYSLLQFVKVAGDYELEKKIQDKIKEELKKPSQSTQITSFNVIAPANASLSCWLNSALMAYLVPLYVACGNDVTKLKENVIFVDNQIYIVNLIHEYIDAHFGKTDRNGYNGDEIIRKIKEYIVRPTVFAVLNNYLEIITPDDTNNQHTFLSSDIFYFDKVLNGSKAIQNVLNKERMNVVPLILNANNIKIDNNTLTIDDKTYEIDEDIRFITFNNEAPGDFGEAVKNFLTQEITVGNKVYERVSFIMASGVHYVVVTKNNDKYLMINDLPPTITEINNVSDLITKRSNLLNKRYYTVGIVYILKDGACPKNKTNVHDLEKLNTEIQSINAENIANKATFKQEILNAINIYNDSTTSENKNPQRNEEQLNKLKNILQRLYPEEYKKKYTQSQPGGSRKNRLKKSKKTKRKYYNYPK